MTETGMIHMRLLISFSCPLQSAYRGREGGEKEKVKEQQKKRRQRDNIMGGREKRKKRE